MAILSENGHAKNVGNFGSLLISIDVLGKAYNPPIPELKTIELKELYTRAKSTLHGVALALQVYVAAIDAREKAWDGLDAMIDRILNIRKLIIEDPEEVELFSSLIDRIKGGSPLPATQAVLQKVKFSVSLTKKPYSDRLQSFEELIQMLISSYNSPEEQLIVESLRSLLQSLKSRNINVSLAEAALNTARSNRNSLLYTPETGLVAVANKVKAYIENGLSEVSPQYRQILTTSFWSLEAFS